MRKGGSHISSRGTFPADSTRPGVEELRPKAAATAGAQVRRGWGGLAVGRVGGAGGDGLPYAMRDEFSGEVGCLFEL